jgi:uncharacterized sulfatase
MNQSAFTYVSKISGLFLLFLLLFHAQSFILNGSPLQLEAITLRYAFRFDVSMTAYLSLPLLALAFLITLFEVKPGKILLKSLAIFEFLFILIPESWDLIYMNYAAKRATFDVYAFYVSGQDQDQFLSLFGRFWHITVFALCYFTLFYFILNSVSRIPLKRIQPIPASISLLIYGGFAFILARNSFGPKPLGVADALVVKDPITGQLTLNSPFVVLKTIQNKALPTTHFLPKNIEQQYVNPRLNLPSKGHEARYNLMFIIVESLGNKQLFQTVQGCPLTPFMDSLANNQANLLGNQGLAEGKSSIECLPAMFAGIPSLLETPYILSNFSTNQLTGFPRVCHEKGYTTYFVHGATRGSMRFDAMANALGFQEQWFRNELPSNPSDLGSWGVHDHAVFKHLSKKIPGIKKPFMMTVFTLSTHEPYDIPTSLQGNYPKLSKEERSYHFIDDQLRLFFLKNSGKSWFKNTVFVITGDHTPVHLDNDQYLISDYYSVPILVCTPLGFEGNLAIREQQDLVPALCRAMQWKTELYSYYNPRDSDVIRYLNGIYYIWNDAYELQFNEATKTWRIRLKKLKKSSDTDKKLLYLNIEESKTKFLSLLQRFRRDLRLNKTHR